MPIMSSQSRDKSPERRRERRERSERSERKEGERKHRPSQTTRSNGSKEDLAIRSNSTREKSESKASLSSSSPRKRSSMPGTADEKDTVLSRAHTVQSSYPTFSKEHSREAVGPRPDVFTPPSTDINASKEKLANLNRIINDGPPSPPLTDKNAGSSKPTPTKPKVTTIAEDDEDNSDSKPSRKLRTRTSKTTSKLRPGSADVSPTRTSTPENGKVRSSAKDRLTSQSTSRSVSQPTRTVSPALKDGKSELSTTASSEATSIAPNQNTQWKPATHVPSAAMVEDHDSSHFHTIPAGIYSRDQTPIEPHVNLQTPFSANGGPPPPPPPPHVPVAVPKVDYLLQHGGLYHSVPRNLLQAGRPVTMHQAQIDPSVMVNTLFGPFTTLLQDYENVMFKNGSLAVATGYRSVARRLLDRLEAVFARDLSSEYCTCIICQQDEQLEDVRGVSWGEILELVSGRQELPAWPPFNLSDHQPDGLGIQQEIQDPMSKLDVDIPEEYRDHYIRQSQKTKKTVDKWLSRQDPQETTPSAAEVDDETLTFAILTHIEPHLRPVYKELLGIVDLPLQPPKRAPSPERANNVPARAPSVIPQRPRQPCIVAAGYAIQRLYRLSIPPRDPETAIFLLNHPYLHHPLATLSAISNDEWDILISGRFDGFLRSGAEEDYPTPSSARHPSSRGTTPFHDPTTRTTNNLSHLGGYIYPRPATAPVSAHAQARFSKNKNSAHHSHSYSNESHPHPSLGGPILLDEETELSTLAAMERDIFASMECLEDAFEQLHLKAERVRQMIRERSAGLSSAAASRRGFDGSGLGMAGVVRGATPATPFGGGVLSGVGTPAGQYAYNDDTFRSYNNNSTGYGQARWEAETDDGIPDNISELMPDDSASNVSAARRRRKGRRRDRERGTPIVGVIREEDFDGDPDGETERESSPEKR